METRVCDSGNDGGGSVKTVIEREVIPPDPEPSVIETTWYVCDECDFKSNEEDETKKHFAKTHASRAELETPRGTIYWFRTEADAKAWLEPNSEWCRVQDVQWGGEGWYTTRRWDQPCPRGCCRDQCIRLFPIETYLQEKIDKVRNIMSDVKNIRQIIREARIP